jgi:hypothetical protein
MNMIPAHLGATIDEIETPALIVDLDALERRSPCDGRPTLAGAKSKIDSLQQHPGQNSNKPEN